MADRGAGRKTASTQKLRKEQSASTRSIQQESTKTEIQQKIGDFPVRSHLEKGISELQGLYEVLVSGDLDARVLTVPEVASILGHKNVGNAVIYGMPEPQEAFAAFAKAME